MVVGRQFRIYPNSAQAQSLNQWIGCQRVIRNAKIEETFNAWQHRQSKRSDTPEAEDKGYFDQSFSQFKTADKPWLREVPSQILRNGVYRAKAAFTRYWKRLASRPVVRGRQSRESVLLTNELFRIEDGKLFIGTKTKVIGWVRWKPHRDFKTPSMLTITRCGDGTWYASFSFEDGVELPTVEDLLVQHSYTAESQIVALDRGVAHPLADSEGKFHDVGAAETARIAKLDTRRGTLQRKLSRQQKGSAQRRRTKKRLARISNRKRNILRNWHHQTTAKITSTPHKVIVLEDLKLANMTKAPQPKPNPAASEPSQPAYLPNGAAAKAGLNRALLQVGLGELSTLLQYKARRTGKAFLLVSPHFSSQECSQCTHTSPDNRPSQAEFYCQACGHKAHADYNASLVLRKRGHQLLQQSRPVGTKGRKTPARSESTPDHRKLPPQRASVGGR